MENLSEEQKKFIYADVYSVVDKLNQEYTDKYEHKEGLPEATKHLMIERGIKMFTDNDVISEDDLKQYKDFKIFFPLKCTLPPNLESQFKNRVTPNDGNCFFHALSDGLSKLIPPIKKNRIEIRDEICNYLCEQDEDNSILKKYHVEAEEENRNLKYDGTIYDKYICRMRENAVYGGPPEIEAASRLYNINIKVYIQSGQEITNYEVIQNSKRTINLFNCSSVVGADARHYEYLEPIQMSGGGSIKNLAKLYDRKLSFGLKNLAKLI